MNLLTSHQDSIGQDNVNSIVVDAHPKSLARRELNFQFDSSSQCVSRGGMRRNRYLNLFHQVFMYGGNILEKLLSVTFGGCDRYDPIPLIVQDLDEKRIKLNGVWWTFRNVGKTEVLKMKPVSIVSRIGLTLVVLPVENDV